MTYKKQSYLQCLWRTSVTQVLVISELRDFFLKASDSLHQFQVTCLEKETYSLCEVAKSLTLWCSPLIQITLINPNPTGAGSGWAAIYLDRLSLGRWVGRTEELGSERTTPGSSRRNTGHVGWASWHALSWEPIILIIQGEETYLKADIIEMSLSSVFSFKWCIRNHSSNLDMFLCGSTTLSPVSVSVSRRLFLSGCLFICLYDVLFIHSSGFSSVICWHLSLNAVWCWTYPVQSESRYLSCFWKFS